MTARPFSPETLADRTDKRGPDDCWNWTGPVLRSGYGNAGAGYRKATGTILAHRVAYLMAHGALPQAPLILRHTCDNRLCCNPRHMVPGTHADNMQDMVKRGRSTKGRKSERGEAHPRAKLANADVIVLRKLNSGGLSNRQIAEKLGVSHVQVGRILRGESRRDC